MTCGAGTATFSDANVGLGKTVTVTGITLGGAAASNYTLTSTSGDDDGGHHGGVR